MDVVDFARYFAALAVVLGLLGLFGMAASRGWLSRLMNGLTTRGLKMTRPERRMRVTESLVLDPRRRVVIVRIDGEEQVLLLGAGTEIVLDKRPASGQPETAS